MLTGHSALWWLVGIKTESDFSVKIQRNKARLDFFRRDFRGCVAHKHIRTYFYKIQSSRVHLCSCFLWISHNFTYFWGGFLEDWTFLNKKVSAMQTSNTQTHMDSQIPWNQKLCRMYSLSADPAGFGCLDLANGTWCVTFPTFLCESVHSAGDKPLCHSGTLACWCNLQRISHCHVTTSVKWTAVLTYCHMCEKLTNWK